MSSQRCSAAACDVLTERPLLTLRWASAGARLTVRQCRQRTAGSLVKQPLETSLSPPPKEETTREMAAVTSLGVDHAQGFLLSRPLTAAQLQDYVADGAINLP